MRRQRQEHKIQQLERAAHRSPEAGRLQEQQQSLEKIRQQLLGAAGLLTSFINQTVDRSVWGPGGPGRPAPLTRGAAWAPSPCVSDPRVRMNSGCTVLCAAVTEVHIPWDWFSPHQLDLFTPRGSRAEHAHPIGGCRVLAMPRPLLMTGCVSWLRSPAWRPGYVV